MNSIGRRKSSDMKRELTFQIPEEFDGKTVLHYLRGHACVSSRLIKRLKRLPDGIQLNGAHTRTIDPIKTGDILELHLPEDETPAEPSAHPLQIHYEDEDVMVLEKPPFMPVHPTRNHQGDTLANAFASYLGKRGRTASFRAVNRLDRDTSGLVAVGLNSYAASRLSGCIEKTYTAIVLGRLTGCGRIDAPIRRPNPLLIRREVGRGGVHAVTNWRCLDYRNEMTLLEIHLETGRTHQIRVHFSHIGHPLVGDTMYGRPHPFINRQALHCSEIAFCHPVSGKKIQVTSQIPKDMENLLFGGNE